VTIELDPAGQVTVTHAGNMIWNKFQLPNYAPITGNAKFGLGARTGGENQKCYIDDSASTTGRSGP